MVKGRIYDSATYGEDGKRAAQSTLYHALLNVLKLLAPFMPHVTEELYQQGFRERVGEKSVHLLRWPEGGADVDEESVRTFDSAVDVVAAVRKYKSENNLSMGAELRRLNLGVDGGDRTRFEAAMAELRSTSRTEEIVFEDGAGVPSDRSEAGVPLWIER